MITVSESLFDLRNAHETEFAILENADALLALAIAASVNGLTRETLEDTLKELGSDKSVIDFLIHSGFMVADSGIVSAPEAARSLLNELHIDIKPLDHYAFTAARLDGIRAEFRDVWDRYQVSFRRYALAKLGDFAAVEDCLQETAKVGYLNLAQFREDSPLHSWLWAILRNQVSDYRRNQARHVSLDSWARSPSFNMEVISIVENPSTELEQKELLTLVSQAVEEIDNERLRTALELRYFDDLSYEQIASELGCTPATARTIVYRARLALIDTPSYKRISVE